MYKIMNIRKTITLLALLAISTVSFSQKLESRLIDRMGEKNIEKIHSFRYDYYHFLIYELNAGYELKSKTELTKEQRIAAENIDGIKSIKENTPLSEDIVKNDGFDFLSYTFQRDMNNDKVYKLSNDSYILIYSKQNISAMYKAKYGTQKRTTPSKK